MPRALRLICVAMMPALAACATDEPPALAPTRPNLIVNGVIDGTNAYPNVGAFIVKGPDGKLFPLCSGTLIGPKVFLTAAHCTIYFTDTLAALGYTASASFDASIPWGDQTVPSTTLYDATSVVTNPGYNQRASDVGDVGVLVLASAPPLPLAVLPTAGLLDKLSAKNGLKSASFTAVGYGVQDRVTGHGQPNFTDSNPEPRRYATEGYNALAPGFLRLSQNPAKGLGGACYGDSGGPNFLDVGGVRTLVAITISGDAVCRSTNAAYRMDIASARGFLAAYATLP